MRTILTRRIVLLYAIVAACFVVLTARLWYVQIYRGLYYTEQAAENRFRLESVRPLRGVIYYRNGEQLVENVPSFDVTILLDELPRKDRAYVLARLAALTGYDVAEFDPGMALALGSPNSPVVLATNLPRDKALAVMEDHTNLPGIGIDLRPMRSYPADGLLSGLVGYVGSIDKASFDASANSEHPYLLDDVVGKAGLERQYETDLRGIPGSRQVEVDVGGRVLQVVRLTPPVSGKSLTITVDARLEQTAARALRAALTASHATTGAVVVLDSRDGAILASVSLPTYDDNMFAKGMSQQEWRRMLDDPDKPLLDRVSGSPFPLGTLIAPFIVGAALQEHDAAPDAPAECPQHVDVTGVIVRASVLAPVQNVNMYDAMARGCDLYFANLVGNPDGSAAIGPKTLAAYIETFGFGKPTGLDEPGEAQGIVPDPAWKQRLYGQLWTPLDTWDMALGRGNLLATPMQVAVAMSAIGNGGTLPRPHYLLRLVDDPASRATTSAAAPVVQQAPRKIPLEGAALKALHAALVRTAHEGLGAGMADLVPEVAGLPGTADIGSEQRIIDAPRTAWWAGYAPAGDPQITVVVVIPGGGQGQDSAETVARQVISAYFDSQRVTGSDGH